MPTRSPCHLAQIADVHTLAAAFHHAAKGKRHRPEVQSVAARLDHELAQLSLDILASRVPTGVWTAFEIHDPKRRQILAPCFRDRVLHHALMMYVAPVLERALVADTFACRPGKGTLAAEQRAQQHVRRFPWFVKVDVRAYFASIDHAILRGILHRRFKNPGLLALFDRILRQTPCGTERGLPIGALTSQHFANSYLDGLDRLLLQTQKVRGLVRYMDDMVWWCTSQAQARATLEAARAYLQRERKLELKPSALLGRSEQGLPFLGFRILPGALRLSLRRRRRYQAARKKWEAAFTDGELDERGLQAGYAAALGITAHADAVAWRRAELLRNPALDV